MIQMIFKFKEPTIKTKNVMADVALNGANKDYKESIEKKIKKLTSHTSVEITNSGNSSIYLALSATGKDLIIPDQGGWNGFKQIGKMLNKNITTLKTNQGIIEAEELKKMKNKSTLIFTSFAGYTAEQDIQEITEICKEKEITTIEDASAGLGDKKKKLGNGKYTDIIITSTGTPKIINATGGGIISANNPKILEKTKIQQKIIKPNEIIASGIDSELENIEEKLKTTMESCKYLKNNLEDVIHQNRRGVNVIVKTSNPKELTWKLKTELKTNKKGFITKCPNYNRIKEKAVAIEVKNLDYNSLKKENLDYIIETINNLQTT